MRPTGRRPTRSPTLLRRPTSSRSRTRSRSRRDRGGRLHPPDAPDICPDAGSTVIYVITIDGLLMSFYPPDGHLHDNRHGPLPHDEPQRRAVLDGGQPPGHRVRRLHAEREPVSREHPDRPVRPHLLRARERRLPQHLRHGLLADVGDAGLGAEAGENLYLAGDPGGVGMGATRLAALDIQTFVTHPIGTVNPPITAAELTGTGSGELFAFYPSGGGSTGMAAIGQDRQAQRGAAVVGELARHRHQPGLGVRLLGRRLHTFTSPDGTSTLVQRYRPSERHGRPRGDAPGARGRRRGRLDLRPHT